MTKSRVEEICESQLMRADRMEIRRRTLEADLETINRRIQDAFSEKRGINTALEDLEAEREQADAEWRRQIQEMMSAPIEETQ